MLQTNLSGIDLKETILAEDYKRDFIRVGLRKTILIGRLGIFTKNKIVKIVIISVYKNRLIKIDLFDKNVLAKK